MHTVRDPDREGLEPASRPPPESPGPGSMQTLRDRPAARPSRGLSAGPSGQKAPPGPVCPRTRPFLPQPAGREEAHSPVPQPRPRLPLARGACPSLASALPPGAVASPASPHGRRRRADTLTPTCRGSDFSRTLGVGCGNRIRDDVPYAVNSLSQVTQPRTPSLAGSRVAGAHALDVCTSQPQVGTHSASPSCRVFVTHPGGLRWP